MTLPPGDGNLGLGSTAELGRSWWSPKLIYSVSSKGIQEGKEAEASTITRAWHRAQGKEGSSEEEDKRRATFFLSTAYHIQVCSGMEAFSSIEHFSLHLSKAAWNIRGISHSMVFYAMMLEQTPAMGIEAQSRT